MLRRNEEPARKAPATTTTADAAPPRVAEDLAFVSHEVLRPFGGPGGRTFERGELVDLTEASNLEMLERGGWIVRLPNDPKVVARVALARADRRAAELARQREEVARGIEQDQAERARLRGRLAELDALLSEREGVRAALDAAGARIRAGEHALAERLPREAAENAARRGAAERSMASIVARERILSDTPPEAA